MIKFCSIISNTRIDKYLSNILKISRRHITFLFKNGSIKVNNLVVPKSYFINIGDEISVELKKFGEKLNYKTLKILWENRDLIAIYKPEKFHSAKLFKSQYSVEDYIQTLNKEFILLNRLDFQTQGIVLVAKNKSIYEQLKISENKLHFEKFYIGILKKQLNKKAIINNKIYSKNKVKVKVLDITSDFHITKVTPIAQYAQFSVVNIKIYKGARHQIRAHLSFIKKPLLFDYKYYEEETQLKENYFLFCYGYKIKKLNVEFFEYKILKEKFAEFLKRNRLG